MKKTKLLGVFCATAMAVVLAACVYDDIPGGNVQVEPPVVEQTTEANNLPTATATFTPGTQTITVPASADPAARATDGTAYSLTTPIVIEVVFGENQIENITVVSHGESSYGSLWYQRAYPMVLDQILVHQSTQAIDTPTGATVTRNAFIRGVEEAIVAAGASPEALTPQIPTAPLAGDRFIPGFHEIEVEASTLDIWGNPLVEGVGRADTMVYHQEDSLNLRVSVGRNSFHVHVGGSHQVGSHPNTTHGESVYALPNAAGLAELANPEGFNDLIGGGTWGGWWFRQAAHHLANDLQTTQWARETRDEPVGAGIDVFVGATPSAAGVLHGIETALNQAGGTGKVYPGPAMGYGIYRNPNSPDAALFTPGDHEMLILAYTNNDFDGVGDIRVVFTLDRTMLRRIRLEDASFPSLGTSGAASGNLLGGDFATVYNPWRNELFRGIAINANNFPAMLEFIYGMEPIEGFEDISSEILRSLRYVLQGANQ
ncbi:MAG: FMN-binding protein [Defluviitaleaceae bacterium]|nr:FMN-binding protein [Defluviitaleaceae bacterium]